MCEVASFKNFENSLTTVKVMTKTKVAPFYLGHGVFYFTTSNEEFTFPLFDAIVDITGEEDIITAISDCVAFLAHLR